MKISCTNTMVPGETLTDKALLLKECGFDAISVFEEIEDWNEAKLREVFSLKERTGMEICEFCFSGSDYGRLMDDSIRQAEASKTLYKRAIEICNQLGAVTEMEYLYQPQSPIPLLHPYQIMNERQQERFYSVLRELAAEVDGNAYLLLEPINRYEAPYLNSLEDNLRVLEELRLPRTGLLADTFHMSIEEKDLCASLLNGRSWIRHVHLGDNNRLLPGNGCLNWKMIFETLRKISYAGYVNLECALSSHNPTEELRVEAAFLREQIDSSLDFD